MTEGHRYSYAARCEHCGRQHRLERTAKAVERVRQLAVEVERDRRFGREGKMFGVLVGAENNGTPVTLRAFSGMLDGVPYAHGFVGPTRCGRTTADLEIGTLPALSALSAQIEALAIDETRRSIELITAPYDREIEELTAKRRINRQARAGQRELLSSGADDSRATSRRAEIDALSQRERGQIRALRRRRRTAIRPLEEELDRLLDTRRHLREERRRRSRELQAAMHSSHGLVNFAGRYALLEDLFGGAGIPSGTGECCAPKLLQEAALRGIRPLGMAEVWCGPAPTDGSKRAGELYGACAEKCAPLLGHQLCGADAPSPGLEIIFEDEHLLVIDKPAGLLSVPGRGARAQDCVETRLQLLRPEESDLRAAHRLDQATSGVLVLARHTRALRDLSGRFASGAVAKVYHALVGGPVVADNGRIDLPLRADPLARPLQIVDHRVGKQASTLFRVLSRRDCGTLLELRPLTGRTHQLRVHCASPQGLNAPILGDAMYGDGTSAERLMLHAFRIEMTHPVSGKPVVFESTSQLPAELRTET